MMLFQKGKYYKISLKGDLFYTGSITDENEDFVIIEDKFKQTVAINKDQIKRTKLMDQLDEEINNE